MTLKCKVNGCYAKAYVKIQPDLVIEVADGKKRPNGKTRKAFIVDYSDPCENLKVTTSCRFKI